MAIPSFGADTPTDAELIRQLAARVDQLEKELKEVQGAASSSADATENTYPKIRFNGFADITYHATHRGDPSHFELGEFDLFINSRISEKAGILAETVVAADGTNNFGVDIERLIFQYNISDAFKLDVGRFHTALGYYNNTYHHGTWFQTATGRPDFVNYEDSGGILPVHTVGLSLHGAIPSGTLGLSYFAEVGNSHQFRNPNLGVNPVANVADVSNSKAVNVALLSRPAGVPGLQFGAGLYHDNLHPDAQIGTVENILNGHVVFKDAHWEFISEVYKISHAPDNGPTTTSTAWFAQVAHQFGKLRPYVRYTSTDIPLTDAAYALVDLAGKRHTVSYGVRWDFTDYASYKMQLDQKTVTGLPVSSDLIFQLAFTF